MTITFKYREGEFIHALQQSFELKRQLFRDAIWLGLMLAYGIYLFTAGTALIPSLILMAIPVVYLSVLTWRSLVFPKKLYEENPSLQGEQSITFLENEVVYHSGAVESKLPWSRFHHFKESSEYLFIYLSQHPVRIIPKRIFESSEELVQFIALLESKLKRRTK